MMQPSAWWHRPARFPGTRSGPMLVRKKWSLLTEKRQAINAIPERKIAVGLRREGAERIIRMKARFRQQFPKAELSFFDSSTHPLGDPALKIPTP